MSVIWEFHEKPRKMALTTQIYQNVLQSSGFSESERLIREAIQNSVDAQASGSKKPVIVEFEQKLLKGNAKKALFESLSLKGGPLKRLKKLGLPEENNLKALNETRARFPVLIISDFNTCGLGGCWNGSKPEDHFGRLVVNLGISDKSAGKEIYGGSFGFGKTVYGKASKIGVVVFYSVFKSSEETEGHHARLMATGLFKDHDLNRRSYSGFAFFGAVDPEFKKESMPLVDEAAHATAKRWGFTTRSEKDVGTSIMILDCNQSVTELAEAAEKFWWPRLVAHGGDGVEIIIRDKDGEIRPRPKSNKFIKPFLDCLSNATSDYQDPPKSKLYPFRAVNTFEGLVKPGTLSCIALDSGEDENPLAHRVALVRNAGMVVNYQLLGNESYEPCVGVFKAHLDIEGYLAYSEPQMHDQWDENSDRLGEKFGPDGSKLVNAVNRRVETSFKDFQKQQEPPIPPSGQRFKELERLMGDFINVPGDNPPPPLPSPENRPVTINVGEDRVKENGLVFDVAEISLNVRKEHETDELECTVSALFELIGDTTHRSLSTTTCTLTDEDGKQIAEGAPAEARVRLSKGTPTRIFAKAPCDPNGMARIRVAVQG
jgi:hypothetical protein